MTNFISSTIPLSRATSRRTGVMGYIDLYRQRRALAALDDTRLADIGLNRAEAEVEAARPVWDAPSYWK